MVPYGSLWTMVPFGSLLLRFLKVSCFFLILEVYSSSFEFLRLVFFSITICSLIRQLGLKGLQSCFSPNLVYIQIYYFQRPINSFTISESHFTMWVRSDFLNWKHTMERKPFWHRTEAQQGSQLFALIWKNKDQFQSIMLSYT